MDNTRAGRPLRQTGQPNEVMKRIISRAGNNSRRGRISGGQQVRRERPQRRSQDARFDRDTRERLAIELFRMELQQTKWRDRLSDALGCDIQDPLISTFRLFDLGLELIGMPVASDSWKDKCMEAYGGMVQTESDVPRYVT